MSSSRVEWVRCAAIGIATFVLGIVVARLPGLKFTNEIRIDTLASIAVTLLLFLFLNVIYQQQLKLEDRQAVDLRNEKDLLIEVLREARSAADELGAMFVECYQRDPLPESSVRSIQNAMQKYQNAVYSVAAALETCEIDGARIGFKDIDGQREAYRGLLTDSPFPVRYDQWIYREQQAFQKKVRDTLLHAMLKVNRL